MKLDICDALTIIFVLCKLFGIITWSWWLCLLPSIADMILSIVIALIIDLFD